MKRKRSSANSDAMHVASILHWQISSAGYLPLGIKSRIDLAQGDNFVMDQSRTQPRGHLS